MGIGIGLMALGAGIAGGSSAYTSHREKRQEKLEKKRTGEAIAKMESEKEAEKQAERKRQADFFESKRKSNLARKQRTQRTFAGMNQDFNPAIMKRKLGQ